MEAVSASRASAPGAALRVTQGPGRTPHRPQVSVPVSLRSLSEALASSWPQRSALCPGTSPSAETWVAFAQRQVTCVADVATVEEVEFKWQGPGAEVLVTGDFLNWDTKLPLLKAGENVFVGKQKLPPGRYSYKFIVDGVWQHSPFHPTVSDGAGGFNNTISIEEKKAPAQAQAAGASEAAAPPPAAAAAKPPPAKKAAPAGKAGGKKAAGKALGPAMIEDVIPALEAALGKEEGIEGLSLVFGDNELRGSFVKNGIPYDFWAYFPDGTLDGARGFSLTSCGNPPSTVEPFIIDERKVTSDLVVFWVLKRLFAQKLLSLN